MEQTLHRSATTTQTDLQTSAASAFKRPERLVSVDVLRGLCVAGMVLVNFPADWVLRYHQLGHAEWDGATATDMIFPAFLLLSGFSMVYSFDSRARRDETRSHLARHVLLRSFILLGLGLILNAFPSFNWHTLHVSGVLQRIAVCYLAGGILVLTTGRRRLGFEVNVWVVVGCMLLVLVGVWSAVRFVQVPGYGAWRFDHDGNLGAVIDRQAKTLLPATGGRCTSNPGGKPFQGTGRVILSYRLRGRLPPPELHESSKAARAEATRPLATNERSIVAEYRRHGFKVALDDLGAGYAGLNLLADFPADIIKLDIELTRDLAQRPLAATIVKAVVELAKTLGSALIAEGVETVEEYAALRACGISLMQGYLFAKPAFEALPALTLPGEKLSAAKLKTSALPAVSSLSPELKLGPAVRVERLQPAVSKVQGLV